MTLLSYENLLTEIRDGVGLITINRPEVLNALNVETLRELYDAVDELGARDDVAGIILTGGGGKAFVAGADIEHLSTLSPQAAYEFSQLGGRTFQRIETVTKPVIAAVNGFALGGGCELALACDFIVASSKAKFGQPEVNLGLIPGFGGTQRLSRLIGKNLTRYLVYTGDIVRADWALSKGLVAEVVEPEQLLERCFDIVKSMAKKGPLAVTYAKQVIQAGYDLPLEAAVDLEARAFSQLFATADMKEGTGAFLEKRKAEFKGE